MTEGTATGDPFSLRGRSAVITGGYGVLGSAISSGLAGAGVRVALLGRRAEAANAAVERIRAAGGDARAVIADVLDDAAVRAARDQLLRSWPRVDILVNAAGGNVARARNDDRPVFDVPMDAFDEVLRLNLHGSVIPSLVFAEAMVLGGADATGSIVTISSMAGMQAISGVLGYSVAKAGVESCTKWMAVELARRNGTAIRVNAIVPGFFVTEQNRHVLVQPDGSPTPRARTIVARTPMGRFGRPDELVGAVRWLCSDAASFVTGTAIPIDGGFSAFSGV